MNDVWLRLVSKAVRELEDSWRPPVFVEATPDLKRLFELLWQLATLPQGLIQDLLAERYPPDYEGLAERLLGVLQGWLEPGTGERNLVVQSAILNCEPIMIKLLAVIDPEKLQSLPAQTRDREGRPRRPTFPDYLIALDLASQEIVARPPEHFRGQPGFKETYARVYRLRNEFAHQAPRLTERECLERLTDVFNAILYALYKHRFRLEAALFNYQRRDYLERVIQRFHRWQQRAVWLSASESAEHQILEPYASEEFEDFADDTWLDDSSTRLADSDMDTEDAGEDEFAERRGLRSGMVRNLVDELQRMVLVGDPGAGKTTTLQYYAYLRAQELRDKPCTDKPCPLYLELRRCSPQRNLWQLLEHEAHSSREQLQQEMQQRRWILLLDGLNEVATSYQEELKREAEELLRNFPGLPLVLTTRPGVEIHRYRLPVFRLDLLTDDRMEEFLVRHWQDAEKAKRFLTVLRKHPALWTWGRNPLHLYMLARLLEQTGGELPENRGQLMRSFIQSLLRREEEKGPQTDRQTKVCLLSEVAFHTRQQGKVAFSRDEFFRVVARASQERGFTVDTRIFLNECLDNHLLVEQDEDEGVLAFAHELYQEYFSAEGLRLRYQQDPSIVDGFAADPNWEQPIALLYGLLEQRQPLLRQLRQHNPSLAAEAVTSQANPPEQELQQVQADVEAILANQSASVEQLFSAFRALLSMGKVDRVVAFLKQPSMRPKVYNRAAEALGRAVLANPEPLPLLLQLFDDFEDSPQVPSVLARALSSCGPTLSATQRNQLRQIFSRYTNKHLQSNWFLDFAKWCYANRIIGDEDVLKCISLLASRNLSQAAKWLAHMHRMDQAQACESIRELVETGYWRVAEMWINKLSTEARDSILTKARFDLQANIWLAAAELVERFAVRDHELLVGVACGLLASNQWSKAVERIDRFGERDRDLLISVARTLLAKKQLARAAEWIKSLGLQTEFPPQELAKQFVEAGNWQAAVEWVKRFELRDSELLIGVARALLANRRWARAAEWIESFGLQTEFPPQELAKQFVEAGNWQAALEWVERFELRDRELLIGVARALLANQQWAKTVRWIKRFGLQTEFPPQELAKQFVEARNWQAAVEWVQGFELRDREILIGVARALLANPRWARGVRWIKRFGLQTEFPPQELAKQFVEVGNWQAAMEWIKRSELRDRDWFVSMARALLAKQRWAEAVRWVKRFGLQKEFPPQELAKQFVEVGNWQAAMGMD